MVTHLGPPLGSCHGPSFVHVCSEDAGMGVGICIGIAGGWHLFMLCMFTFMIHRRMFTLMLSRWQDSHIVSCCLHHGGVPSLFVSLSWAFNELTGAIMPTSLNEGRGGAGCIRLNLWGQQT